MKNSNSSVFLFFLVILLAASCNSSSREATDEEPLSDATLEVRAPDTTACAIRSIEGAVLNYYDSLISRTASVWTVQILPDCPSADPTNCTPFTIIKQDGSLEEERMKKLTQLQLGPWEMAEVFSGYVESDMITFCYLPRDGLAFYNEAGEIVQFFELCFECDAFVAWKPAPGFAQQVCSIQKEAAAKLLGKI